MWAVALRNGHESFHFVRNGSESFLDKPETGLIKALAARAGYIGLRT